MKWWSKFWKIRKQKDKVKLILLFVLLGIGFLGHLIYEGICLYQITITPAEYILTCQNAAGITDNQMKELWEQEQVSAVSRQQELSLELAGQRGKMNLTCLEVSQSYLENAYGIRSCSSMQVFYVNKLAYDELTRSMGYAEGGEAPPTEWNMGYVLGGEDSGMAKIIFVSEGIPNDQPYAFHEGSSVKLAKNSPAIRVQVRKQDLDGMQVQRFQQSGLEIVNNTEVEETLFRQETLLLQMKYDCMIAMLCLLFAGCLKKFGKE